MTPVADVYFVDVGQGTSQVILFKDSSVVIIDCGESSLALANLLNSLEFGKIRAVILSHWDSDHAWGAPFILSQFADRIERLHISFDRPADELIQLPIFKSVIAQAKALGIPVASLVYNDVIKGRVYPHAEDDSQASLKIVFPDAVSQITAQATGDPNQCSAILILEYKKSRIIFPGDAGKHSFKAAVDLLGGNNPLPCCVVVAPHHSGRLVDGKASFKGYLDCYEWFYSKIVKAKHVLVSAGTGNIYGHPNPAHIQAARKSGAHVICTQITARCHHDPQLLNPGGIDKGKWASESKLGNGVGCAGTILAAVCDTGVKIRRLKSHSTSVDQKLDPTVALCRK